jgi:serine/threonine-protein kinase SRPK3
MFRSIPVHMELNASLREHKYHAVKILTANATEGQHQGRLCELEILKAIGDLGDEREYLPMLRDHFQEKGPHGDHLCLAMDVLSTDVSTLRRSAPHKALPLHMV